ncbi:MAG: type II CAAX endopeptidase family protein [Chloroflexota bacterium]
MNKTLRNLIIFAVVSALSGWLGVWINRVIPSPSPQQSLGLLVFITLPLLTSLFLRGFGGDGWSDFGLRLNLKGNLGWYAFSLLLYPATIFLTLGLGAVFGAVSFEGLATKGFGALLPVVAFGFAASLVKNVGEEFAWRGYLTPRFEALGLGNLANHILTALVWGLWHLPYWLFFLGNDLIASYTSIGKTWFILLGFIGLFPTSLIYGEMRLKTGSLWPAYIAHNVTNAVSAQLILEGFVEISPSAEFVFSPNLDSLLMIGLFLGIGLWMLRKGQAKP